jgi:hypothetical protein
MTRRLRSVPERISKLTWTGCADWVNCGARAFPVRSVVTRGLPLRAPFPNVSTRDLTSIVICHPSRGAWFSDGSRWSKSAVSSRS